MLKRAMLLLLLMMATRAAVAQTLPREWTEAQGNPLIVDGQPRWRADRLWPDDPLQYDAYQPMPWNQGAWRAIEQAHGGQPRIERRDQGVMLSARSAAPNRPGLKIPALVYVAPRGGWYGLRGQATAKVFDGKGPATLLLVKRAGGAAEQVKQWIVPAGEPVALDRVAVQLEPGDELALVLEMKNGGADVMISELSIGTDLSDDSTREAQEHLAQMPVSEARLPSREQIDAANAAVTGGGVVYPADSGVLNVRAFGARGDGVHDDTAAFALALSEHNGLIYVPDGVYLISDTLRWGGRQSRTILEGQSEQGTIIKLVDRCPGYDDPAMTKAMVWTGKAPAQRFRNGIRNLTFDTGVGNPGATGVQYIANNQGAMRNVTIRSGDPQRVGVIGLDLGYTNEQGPCLIQHVTVEGFDIGVRTKHAVDGVVAEHITLRGQRQVGWLNDGQCVSLSHLHSHNSVPAYHNREQASLTAIIDSELVGTDGAAEHPAIINERGLFARNITTRGYAMAIRGDQARDGTRRNVVEPNVDEYVSHDVLTLPPSTDGAARSLALPIKPTPQVDWGDPADWVAVTRYEPVEIEGPPAKNGKPRRLTDWAPALQQAIDSGARTVYFPRGQTKYGLFSPIHVRGRVERIIGLETSSEAAPGNVHIPGQAPPLSPFWPTFIIEDGQAPVVVIEHMDLIYGAVRLIHQSDRTVVVRSLAMHHIETRPGAGDLFIDDVVAARVQLAPGTRVWARQLNIENWYEPKSINDGGQFWVLGIKTETDTTVHTVTGGGRSEIIGGFIYANKANDPEKVMFRVEGDGDLSCTVGEWVGRKQPFTPAVLTRGGRTFVLGHADVPRRGEGSLIPLLVID